MPTTVTATPYGTAAAIVRGCEWPIDLSEGLWDMGDESTLREAFNEAAEVATELCIRPLKAGADIVTLGGPNRPGDPQRSCAPLVACIHHIGIVRIE